MERIKIASEISKTLPELLPLKGELTSERFMSLSNHKPFTLEVCASYRCPSRCVYCYVYENVVDNNNSDMSIDKLKSLIFEAKEIGVKEIGWLGGEPLSYKYIIEASKYIKELGLNNNLRTNGVLLSKLDSNQLSLFDQIRVHLDTINPNVYKEITNLNSKILNSVISSIKNLKSNGIHDLQMVAVVSNKNIHVIKDLIDWAIDEMRIPLMLLRFRAARDAKGKNLEINDNDYKNILKYYYTKIGLNYSNSLLPNLCSRSSIYCQTEFFVDVDFSIHPCDMVYNPSWKYEIGSLEKIWKENSQKFRYEPINSKNLIGCKTCKFSPLCFGCRSIAEVEGGDLHGADPSCEIVKKSMS